MVFFIILIYSLTFIFFFAGGLAGFRPWDVFWHCEKPVLGFRCVLRLKVLKSGLRV